MILASWFGIKLLFVLHVSQHARTMLCTMMQNCACIARMVTPCIKGLQGAQSRAICLLRICRHYAARPSSSCWVPSCDASAHYVSASRRARARQLISASPINSATQQMAGSWRVKRCSRLQHHSMGRQQCCLAGHRMGRWMHPVHSATAAVPSPCHMMLAVTAGSAARASRTDM